MPRPYANTPEKRLAKFWGRVVKHDGGCWEWQGPLYKNGYGHCQRIDDGRVDAYTHRLSWEMHRGPIPAGLWVLHRCDNRKCVNPEHLWLGTVLDNNRDCAEKGRHYSHFRGVTHCKAGHALTPDNVRVSQSWRHCRTCARDYTRRYRERRAA